MFFDKFLNCQFLLFVQFILFSDKFDFLFDIQITIDFDFFHIILINIDLETQNMTSSFRFVSLSNSWLAKTSTLFIYLSLKVTFIHFLLYSFDFFFDLYKVFFTDYFFLWNCNKSLICIGTKFLKDVSSILSLFLHILLFCLVLNIVVFKGLIIKLDLILIKIHLIIFLTITENSKNKKSKIFD